MYRADLVITHSLYDSDRLENDIALVRVAQSIQYNDYIQPACVADSAYNISRAYECYTSGWGRTSLSAGENSVQRVFWSLVTFHISII